MAAAADATEGAMSDTEPTKRSPSESEPPPPRGLSSTEDEAVSAEHVEDDETAAADADSVEPDEDVEGDESAAADADSDEPDEDVEDDETSAADADPDDPGDPGDDADAKLAKRRFSMSPVRLATVVGVVAVLALGVVVGWQGYRTYQLRQDQDQRELFLQVGRQGAVNLTTIDWQNVNHDIQRILDSATGSFYDDFSNDRNRSST